MERRRGCYEIIRHSYQEPEKNQPGPGTGKQRDCKIYEEEYINFEE